MTVKCSQDRNVRSLAKKTYKSACKSEMTWFHSKKRKRRTLGSTRTGRAIRLPGGPVMIAVEDMAMECVCGRYRGMNRVDESTLEESNK